jgi:TatD DNase family protein
MLLALSSGIKVKRGLVLAIEFAGMLIDTHTHLLNEAFDGEREAVLQRAREAGVTRMVDVGITVEGSQRSVEAAARYPEVYAAVGVHPYNGDTVDEAAIGVLRGLAAQPRVVALGETGIDLFNVYSSVEGQVRSLRGHLELAVETGLPVILHLRASKNPEQVPDAYLQCLEELEPYRGRVRGISHCFSAGPDIAERFCDLGFYISFAGNVTYRSAELLREAAKATPKDRILVETDAPYLAPQGQRGKRNEPAFCRLTAEQLAESLGLDFSTFARQVTENAERIFGLS